MWQFSLLTFYLHFYLNEICFFHNYNNIIMVGVWINHSIILLLLLFQVFLFAHRYYFFLHAVFLSILFHPWDQPIIKATERSCSEVAEETKKNQKSKKLIHLKCQCPALCSPRLDFAGLRPVRLEFGWTLVVLSPTIWTAPQSLNCMQWASVTKSYYIRWMFWTT